MQDTLHNCINRNSRKGIVKNVVDVCECVCHESGEGEPQTSVESSPRTQNGKTAKRNIEIVHAIKLKCANNKNANAAVKHLE